MNKGENLAIIKFLFIKGKSPTEIKTNLDSIYGDTVIFSTIKTWVADFKRGSKVF